MALARLDIPGLVLYNGSIAPGRYQARDVTIQDVFEAVGAHAAGKMTARTCTSSRASPAPAPAPAAASSPRTRCRRRSTSSASRPAGLNGIPALHPGKDAAADEAGGSRCGSCADDVRPSQIITREALDNAVASIAATGGSTNGVLHLLAIARELGIPYTIDDFDTIAARTPIVAT